jgi:hypothetical protein
VNDAFEKRSRYRAARFCSNPTGLSGCAGNHSVYYRPRAARAAGPPVDEPEEGSYYVARRACFITGKARGSGTRPPPG